MSELTARVFKSLGRHFVTLSCVQYVAASDEERVHVFSGFLLEAADHWFLITAGHIIREIQEALEKGATFDVWRIDDQMAGNNFHGLAVPFNFDPEEWLVLYSDELGLDYAAYALRPIYRQALEAGQSMAISKNAWGDYLMEADYWAVVGIPAETVQYKNQTIITGRVVQAILDPAEIPSEAGSEQQNRFYARLRDDYIHYLTDVKGMSGGPLFAIKKVAGEWKYTLIGVQSSWFRSNQTVSACPMSTFGAELENLVQDVLTTIAKGQE